MSRSSLTACLAALALAAVVGVRLGGNEGVGVVAGALFGGAVGLFSQRLMSRSLARDFQASLTALLVAFGLKLGVIVGAWALLVYVPALGALASPSTFLLAFVATALLLLGVGSFEHLRALSNVDSERGQPAFGTTPRGAGETLP